jgi:polyhydroxyalkanoate synthase
MNPIRIEPQQALDEARRLQQKLAAAAKTLREVEDVKVGVTPREVVYREDKITLYRFRGTGAPTRKTPLLIVYALVNTPYMVDLQDDRSLVKNLLALGQDVYLIDWGYPDGADRFLSLDDYINGYIDRCVDVLRERHDVDAINMLGICQGGAFALCYAALHPDRVRNLVTMVTPVDFHTDDNMLSNWVRDLDADLFVDTLGNVPADVMNYCYLMLKPFRLNLQKYVGLVDILDDKGAVEDFLRMEKWIFDSPDQAGEAFRQFIKQFYQANGFVNGGIRIGGRDVHLGLVEMPVLNIFAEQDHLVPPGSSKALKGLVGSDDYTELSFRGGHIGIYVSGRAQKEVPQTIHDWLAKRSG